MEKQSIPDRKCLVREDPQVVQHLTADEVAARFGVARWVIYQLARKGALRVVRIGRRMRFRLEDVEAFEEAGGTMGESS